MSASSITQKRGRFRLILAVAIFSITFSSIISPLVSAVNSANDMTPTELAKSYAYATAITKCFKDGSTSTKESDVSSGKIFSSEPNTKPTFTLFLQGVGVNVDNDGYAIKCKDTSWIKDAAALWGISTTDIMCGAGFVRSSGHTDCINGTGDFKNSVTSGEGGGISYQNSQKFQDYIRKTVYNNETGQPNLGVAATYVMALNAFNVGCLGTTNPSTYSGSASSSDKYLYQNVRVVDPTTGESKTVKYYATSENKKGRDEKIQWRMDGTLVTENSCQELVDTINQNAVAYQKAISSLKAEGKDDTTPRGKTVDCSKDESKDDPSCTEGITTCTIDGIGWIVCPVMTFLGGINDAAYAVISSLLHVDSTLTTSTELRTAWSSFRNIANIAFVIVFLVIIYSQITGAGINSYGIKRLLPKLLISAVLVNVSFYICQIAVDISNILGYGISDFFSNIVTGSGTASSSILDKAGQAVTWVGIVAGVTGAAVVAALAVSVPTLIASLIAVLMILLILLAREALIIVLIAISPLAFVAYLLPNTEQWFKKWFKLFSSLLLLFPTVALVFAGSKLAATIVANTAASEDWLTQATAMAIAAVPLFAVPSLLKGALNATGSLGAKIGGLSGKANSNIGKAVKNTSRLGEAKRAHDVRTAQRRATRRQNSRLSSALDSESANSGWKRNAGRRFRTFIGDTRGAAVAVAETDKIAAQAVEERKALLLNEHGPADILSADSAGRPQSVDDIRQNGAISGVALDLESALSSGDTEGARAATQILLAKGAPGRGQVRGIMAQYQSSNPAFASNGTYQGLQQELSSANLKASDNVLAMSAVTTQSVSDLEASPQTYSGLDAPEMAGQTEADIQRAVDADIIDPARAQRLLDNPNLKLSPGKETILRRVASRQNLNTATSTSQGRSQPSNPTPMPTGGVPNVYPSADSSQGQQAPSSTQPQNPNSSSETLDIPHDNE